MLDRISPELSRRIIFLLREDGLSLTEIAKEAGTTVAYLRKVDAGEAALKPGHLERLDDAHPGLPFRIGRELVKENVGKIGERGRTVAKKIQKRGGQAVDSVSQKLREGAWSLLNKTLDDS